MKLSNKQSPVFWQTVSSMSTVLPSLAVGFLLRICHSSELKETSRFKLERTGKTDERTKSEKMLVRKVQSI